MEPAYADLRDVIAGNATILAARWRVDRDDLIQHGWLTALSALRRWDPVVGPWQPYVSTIVWRACQRYAALERQRLARLAPLEEREHDDTPERALSQARAVHALTLVVREIGDEPQARPGQTEMSNRMERFRWRARARKKLRNRAAVIADYLAEAQSA